MRILRFSRETLLNLNRHNTPATTVLCYCSFAQSERTNRLHQARQAASAIASRSIATNFSTQARTE